MKVQINGMDVDVQEGDVITASWGPTDKTLQVQVWRGEELAFIKEECYK